MMNDILRNSVFRLYGVAGKPDDALDDPLMHGFVVNAVLFVCFDDDNVAVFRGNRGIDEQIIPRFQGRLHRGAYDLHAYEYLREQYSKAEKNGEQDDKKANCRQKFSVRVAPLCKQLAEFVFFLHAVSLFFDRAQKFIAGKHHDPAAFIALDFEIRADADDRPAVGAAGMFLFGDDFISY